MREEPDEPRELPREMEAHERGIPFSQLLEEYEVDTEEHFYLGAYERQLLLFVQARIREAQFADAWHILPGNLPIDQQPWWKTEVWGRYLAGYSETIGKE
ncbi:hypothetical protein LCGC14_1749410 [marine sediment metagenome]|uniref:Uncharacterized protein n=1 Tax=marine sediment metagenome TaxID=412755 RepID=A0A0F9H4E1_9ZZZZ